tara:strand:- start:633 stop:1676 length:1044 start_codon:yes stop_codon:yes gene_type:complete
MGGTPNEGIMTGLTKPKRMGYAEGSGLPGILMGPQETDFEQIDLFDPIAEQRNRLLRIQQKSQEGKFLTKEERDLATEFGIKSFPEIQKAKKTEEGYTPVDIANVGITSDLTPVKTEPNKEPKKEPKTTPTITIPKKDEEPSDEETLKSYMDMFSKAFKDSPEDISRQRYLELARFGANLLAQPGGSLTAAIGRAAAPAIEGLTKSELARKAGEKEVKLAALQTAIRQMDNPTMDKINALAKASNMSKSEVAKNLILDRTADTTKQDRIKITQAALEGELGAGPALKIAQALEADNAVLAQAEPIEIDKETKKPKEGVADGYYYDESGKLYKVTDGKPAIVKIQKEK